MNWLRNWWRNRNRLIYRYWDGARMRRADPILVHRNLRLCDKWDMENDLEFHLKGHQEATLRCIAAAREVFEIPVLDDRKGLTEEETLDTLAGFIIWVDELKKNSRPQPTSRESPPLSPLSEVGSEPITNPSAGCISISNGSNSDSPAA